MEDFCICCFFALCCFLLDFDRTSIKPSSSLGLAELTTETASSNSAADSDVPFIALQSPPGIGGGESRKLGLSQYDGGASALIDISGMISPAGGGLRNPPRFDG